MRLSRLSDPLDAALRARPAFLIIGTQKAGTTSLHRYLERHPRLAPARRKELHYFNLYHDRGCAWYLRQFPWRHRARGRLTFEATPDYLRHPEAPARVRRELGRVKLIAVLREPADRAWSAWRMWRRIADDPDPAKARRGDPRGFAEAIEAELASPDHEADGPFHYVDMGHYAEHIARWRAEFPEENLMILDHAEMERDLGAVLDRICRFLGIAGFPPERIAAFAGERHWAGPAWSPSEADARALERLRVHYAPRDAELERLLGRPLGWAAPARGLAAGNAA